MVNILSSGLQYSNGVLRLFIAIYMAFGENAKYILNKIKVLDATIINIRHLGEQSINQITKDIEGNILEKKEPENTKKRLIVIVNEVKEKMK
jgi:hypothetical protein